MKRTDRLLLVALISFTVLSSGMASSKKKDAAKGTKGYVQDIESITDKNEDYRKVLYTAKHSQLVVMSLKSKEEIGMESHKPDQFIRVEKGSGEVVINGVTTPVEAGFAAIFPGGSKHNVINTGSSTMKLYTIYSPPNHRDGVVHRTRAEGETDDEHFDGKTTKL
jgi:mannose-6-phosphate isomerase-like protein (cupin superfamily)